MRKRKKKFIKYISLSIFLLIVFVSVMAAIVMYTKNTELTKDLSDRCIQLSNTTGNVSISGNIDNITYRFDAPSYFAESKEEKEQGIYYYADSNKRLKPAFYVFILSDNASNYEEEYKTHAINMKKQMYYFQPIKNNKNDAFFIEARSEEDGFQNIMTIEHTDFCGKHIEFNCAAFCKDKFKMCEDIFDSLNLTCGDN